MCYLKHNIVFAGDLGDMGASLLLTLQSTKIARVIIVCIQISISTDYFKLLEAVTKKVNFIWLLGL